MFSVWLGHFFFHPCLSKWRKIGKSKATSALHILTIQSEQHYPTAGEERCPWLEPSCPSRGHMAATSSCLAAEKWNGWNGSRAGQETGKCYCYCHNKYPKSSGGTQWVKLCSELTEHRVPARRGGRLDAWCSLQGDECLQLLNSKYGVKRVQMK